MRFRILTLIFVMSIYSLITAMGDSGGSFARIPRVERNYEVSVVDAAGKKISGGQFSWEGRLHFSGYLGMAQVTVPFERVKGLVVGEKRDRNVKVVAKLAEGGETEFEMDAASRCFGDAPMGYFMLRMDEIKSIDFK